MKCVYPVILSPCDGSVLVTIPDFDANTQGRDLAEAIDMARDAIGGMVLVMQDEGMKVPDASALTEVHGECEGDVVTLVDIDIDEYRRKMDLRTVKKNCTIPSWLNYAAEQAGLNFSSLLAEAIRTKLNLPERV